MAGVHSSSLLSRTRSGRVPNGKTPALPGALSGSVSSLANAGATVSTQVLISTSNISIFLTNLRLLDLDLLPDWPNITTRTFASKDATHGQKKRIQCVEWALYQLFCLWDTEEARSMRPFFPPADQVQSLNLRASLLRGLEQAKKNGTLGRDAIIRKTMLDDCRGERLEEILAVFSSAVLKKVVAEYHLNNKQDYPAAAETLALENRGYSSDRTELNGLILAHKSSLSRTLQARETARERYRDFSVLLDLKQRSLARRREFAKAAEEQSTQSMADSISEDAKQDLWKIVRNNWTGSEQWMVTLLHGDDRERKDELLATPYDRVWRRVQAGRLGELEGQGPAGLLEQLDRQVQRHHERLQQWQAFHRNLFRGPTDNSTHASRTTPKTQRGVDLGFNTHTSLYPTMSSPRKARKKTFVPLRSDYADLMGGLEFELGQANNSDTKALSTFLQSRRKAARQSSRARKMSAETLDDEPTSEISDIDDHSTVKTPPAPPPEDTRTLSRSTQRVLLRDKGKAYSVKSYDSDDEPELPSQSFRRAATDVAHTLPTELAQTTIQDLPIRRRQTAPLASSTRPSAKFNSPPKTPSPTRLPPKMADEPVEDHVSPPPIEEEEMPSPTEDMADEILASMDKASPSPVKKSRYTLSLAERTRMSMAHSSRAPKVHVDDNDDNEPDLDALTIRRSVNPEAHTKAKDTGHEQSDSARKAEGGYEDLIARTRKSMMGFEASRQKAQLERKRSQRKSKHGARPSASMSMRRDTNGHGMAPAPLVEEEERTVILTEELISSQQDDAEAIFRSRPKIKMSPIPSHEDMY